jgi:hypothetical protein
MPIFNEPGLVGEYDFIIFDRWGEMIFESHAVHEPWNGTVFNRGGEVVKEEVYVWKLIWKDGRSREKHDVIGHVTLLK